MTDGPRRVVLLGPLDRPETLARVLADQAADGRVATVQAGRQEWEGDESPLTRALGSRALELCLHGRAEHIWTEDPELTEAHRRMQQDVRTLRRTYNVRLSRLMDAWLELLDYEGPSRVLDPEREAALEAVRDLDEHQRQRVAEIRADYSARMRPADRPSVSRARSQVAHLLDGVPTVVIDGGHVAVTLNRMRLFRMTELLAGRTVIGVSGGAMVLADRLVLFHDSPPWGPGHPEVAESGLGLAPGVVALPHARERLRLDDQGRLGRLARRFAPADCVLLEERSRLVWTDDRWSAEETRSVTPDGGLTRWGAAA